jgi:endonuclease/exonuclease/phosphatase family metal-dependent hydrolase
MLDARNSLLLGLTLACLAACTPNTRTQPGDQDAGGAAEDVGRDPPGVITVMTWNICYGGGGVGGIPELGNMFESVRKTNFPERASRIARIIDQQQPQVICLQEVARWNRDEIIGNDDDSIDFLDLLLDRIEGRGLHYDVSGSLQTIDFKAPAIGGGGLAKVKWQERIVMLTRRSGQVRVSNVRQQHYHKTYSISIPANDDLTFNRGWIAADIACNGTKARYVCTHLEALSGSVRDAQAEELIDLLTETKLPVVLMGDMNAEPGSNVYKQFTNAGYADAWAAGHGSSEGSTCCQSGDLQNDKSELSRRIDQVFLRGAATPISSARAGYRPSDRTPSGLWPSDHAAVVAKLRLE